MARQTLAATLFIVLLGGCSDDSSGSSNADAQPDVIVETGPEDGGEDDDAAVDGAGDGAADLAAEADVPSDGERDLADADLSADASDAADADATDLADESRDLIVPDLPSDLVEFEICPYTTESATADCAALCGSVGDCSGEDAEAACLAFCETAKSLVTQAAGEALASCVTTTVCEDLPEGVELGTFCLAAALDSLDENPAATTACAAVDAAIEVCEGGESDFDTECGTVAPTFRSETVPLLEGCAEVACNRISDCVSAVVCDILL